MEITLYERALCCSTGVCGPTVDPELLMITTAFETLQKTAGITAKRFNLSQDPKAFSQNEAVLAAIKADGAAALPLTMVDHKIVKKGAYPSLAELSQLTQVSLAQTETAGTKDNGGCC